MRMKLFIIPGIVGLGIANILAIPDALITETNVASETSVGPSWQLFDQAMVAAFKHKANNLGWVKSSSELLNLATGTYLCIAQAPGIMTGVAIGILAERPADQKKTISGPAKTL